MLLRSGPSISNNILEFNGFRVWLAHITQDEKSRLKKHDVCECETSWLQKLKPDSGNLQLQSPEARMEDDRTTKQARVHVPWNRGYLKKPDVHLIYETLDYKQKYYAIVRYTDAEGVTEDESKGWPHQNSTVGDQQGSQRSSSFLHPIRGNVNPSLLRLNKKYPGHNFQVSLRLWRLKSVITDICIEEPKMHKLEFDELDSLEGDPFTQIDFVFCHNHATACTPAHHDPDNGSVYIRPRGKRPQSSRSTSRSTKRQRHSSVETGDQDDDLSVRRESVEQDCLRSPDSSNERSPDTSDRNNGVGEARKLLKEKEDELAEMRKQRDDARRKFQSKHDTLGSQLVQYEQLKDKFDKLEDENTRNISKIKEYERRRQKDVPDRNEKLRKEIRKELELDDRLEGPVKDKQIEDLKQYRKKLEDERDKLRSKNQELKREAEKRQGTEIRRELENEKNKVLVLQKQRDAAVKKWHEAEARILDMEVDKACN